MRESPLKAGVLGLGETGRLMLEAAAKVEYFKIVAAADSDGKLAEEAAKEYNCAAYDDYRRLIIQNQLDCLFVAAPIHACGEFLKMAIKKKFHILKAPPPARNFGEAAEFVKLAQNEGVTFAAASAGRFAASSLAMRGFVLGHLNEPPFFISAGANSNADTSNPKWRDDPVLAGGGVILHDCWEIIDRIIWNYGLPQQIYCITGNNAPDMQQRLYRTEDSAVLTMKFGDVLCGSLLAGRAAAMPLDGELRDGLIARGQEKIIRCDDKSFEVMDWQGKSKGKENFSDTPLSRMKEAIENFGSYLLWPDKNPLVTTAADNLKNMAVIDAAYLSARTGMPEEPAKILKIS